VRDIRAALSAQKNLQRCQSQFGLKRREWKWVISYVLCIFYHYRYDSSSRSSSGRLLKTKGEVPVYGGYSVF
jgi:hypothetical protein